MNVTHFEILVNNYQAIRKIKFNNVKRLIEDFDYREYLRKKEENFRKIKQLIENFKSDDIYKEFIKFDLFKALKLNLKENQISNIIAFVLNSQNVKCAKYILIDILKESQRYASKEQSVRVEKIINVVTATSNDSIKVKREYIGNKSRIDIRIFSRYFVIDIEMKYHNSSETYINGEYQTKREYDDLRIFTEKNKIDNYIGLYISPFGNHPISLNFISLPLYKLAKIIVNWINEVLKNDLEDYLDKEIYFVLKHFFSSKYIF